MHFLISGIPASGKSTFCRWLEEKKGFLHLDVEEDGVLDRHGGTIHRGPGQIQAPGGHRLGFPTGAPQHCPQALRKWSNALVVRRRLDCREAQISATSLPPRARLR